MRLFILIVVFCMFHYDDTTPNQPAFSTGRQQKKKYTKFTHLMPYVLYLCRK